ALLEGVRQGPTEGCGSFPGVSVTPKLLVQHQPASRRPVTSGRTRARALFDRPRPAGCGWLCTTPAREVRRVIAANHGSTVTTAAQEPVGSAAPHGATSTSSAPA